MTFFDQYGPTILASLDELRRELKRVETMPVRPWNGRRQLPLFVMQPSGWYRRDQKVSNLSQQC